MVLKLKQERAMRRRSVLGYSSSPATISPPHSLFQAGAHSYEEIREIVIDILLSREAGELRTYEPWHSAQLPLACQAFFRGSSRLRDMRRVKLCSNLPRRRVNSQRMSALRPHAGRFDPAGVVIQIFFPDDQRSARQCLWRWQCLQVRTVIEIRQARALWLQFAYLCWF